MTLIIKILAVSLLFASTPLAMAAETLPEPITEEEMDALIATADQFYKSGKYSEAFLTYRNELAPRGDAFGQYLTGFMLHHGQGVDPDPIAGAAWMKLAADQGHLPLIQAAKKAIKALDQSQREQADTTYVGLKDAYGDCALLAGRIAFLEENIQPITGSRVAENVSRVTVLYQFGPDLGFQQREMRMREMLKIQRKAYRKECR